MNYEIVIGLEVHCQLSTQSKIFTSDTNKFGSEPNTNIGVITLAHPGVLPKLNKEAVQFAVKMGLACQSTISQYTYFDRKNYFYPDLPKGYQTSQDKFPICVGGEIPVRWKEGRNLIEKNVQIHHIHLEEDAGKSIHDLSDSFTYLDYNRAGTPLIEMVTDPCLHSAEEAGAFLTEVRKLVRFLEICDGNMEEGSMRADLNISLRRNGTSTFGTKVEIKNMNSIRNLQRAVEYEAKRQAEILDAGGEILQETRSFDADSGKTHGMRVKETMNDYRYFPEPDLAPIVITDEELEKIKAKMPALPNHLYTKFKNEFKLLEDHALILTEEKAIADYFLELVRHISNYKTASNWLTSTVKGWLNEQGKSFATFELSPARLAELIQLVEDNKVSNSAASQKLFPLLIESPEDTALHLAEKHGLLQQSDNQLVQNWIDEVLNENSGKVAEFKKGKKGLLGLFVGEVMKKSKGSADPKVVNELVLKSLS
ncbi:MAG: Asp-tRNA(Asn)/Glu-tRNA(Gln) amidotransferase subunit GatB [Spirosomataceae bacterium]